MSSILNTLPINQICLTASKSEQKSDILETKMNYLRDIYKSHQRDQKYNQSKQNYNVIKKHNNNRWLIIYEKMVSITKKFFF